MVMILRNLPNHPFRGENRQHGSAAFRPTRHPLQQIKDRDAALVSNRWRIARNRGTKRPRGIQRDVYGNSPNSCFQNSALQTLFHLSKFLNWIAEHNTNGDYVCIPGQVAGIGGIVAPIGCIPCSLKHLADYYWSAQNQNNDGTPRRIPDSHPDLQPLRDVALQQFGVLQGDPFEFISLLLDCCDQQTWGVRTYTGPPPQPQMSPWHSQLAALFVNTTVEPRVCTRCNSINVISLPPDELPYLTRDGSTNPDLEDWNPNPIGGNNYALAQVTVRPPWNGPDTLQRAFAEVFEDEFGLMRTCQTCHPAQNGLEPHNKTSKIAGARQKLPPSRSEER